MNDSLHNTRLSSNANMYLLAGKADSTRGTYLSAIRLFLSWCSDNDYIPYVPINDFLLIEYIVYRADSVTASTIIGDISAIHYWHTFHGYLNFHSSTVKEVLNGVRRIQQRPQDQRSPIELPTLNNILNAIAANNLDGITIRVGLMIGYYGLLRPSEWAADRCINPNTDRLLTLRTLVFEPNIYYPTSMSFVLKISKNDPFAVCRRIYIPRNTNPNQPCPVTETIVMLVLRFGSLEAAASRVGQCDEPLLQLSRNRVLSTALARRRLREACQLINIDDTRHTLHSLRIGAATYLGRQGVPVDDIRRLGGWRSMAVHGYIRLDREWALATAAWLCNTNTNNNP